LTGLSRRHFFGLGVAGAAVPMMLAGSPGRSWAGVPELPPAWVPPSSVQPPTIGALKHIARQFHMHLTDADLEEYRALMGGVLGSYKRLDLYAEPRLPVKYPRSPGYRPPASENPLNAW
jgi:amidase